MKKVNGIIVILGIFFTLFIIIKLVLNIKKKEEIRKEMKIDKEIGIEKTNELLDSLLKESSKDIKLGVNIKDEILDLEGNPIAKDNFEIEDINFSKLTFEQVSSLFTSTSKDKEAILLVVEAKLLSKEKKIKYSGVSLIPKSYKIINDKKHSFDVINSDEETYHLELTDEEFREYIVSGFIYIKKH